MKKQQAGLFIFMALFITMFIFSPANATALEDSANQTNEFIAVAVIIFGFMLGAQFGHTR